jgi:DHA2 family multidrug resistance protein-like MFS transporter
MDETDGLAPPARRKAITTIALAVGVSVLDTAVANIALPTMATDFGTSASSTIWVVTAYQLAMTICLLPFASLGDVYGYRRVYLAGLSVFTVASLLCGRSASLPMLIVARVLQGLGAAGIVSVNTALVRFIFPRSMLGRGVATTALVVASCSAAGPSVAAGILALGSWHWLFLPNVPIGAAALWLGLKSIPQTPRAGHRFDLPSAVLNALTFGLLLIGLDSLGHREDPWLVWPELVVGAVAGAVFVARQLTLSAPMLPLDLFRAPVFALSVATSVCSYAAQTIAYLALPFYFQVAGGLSQSHVGLLITPWPAVVVIVAPMAGRLSDRYSAGLLGGLGLGVLTAGLLLAMALSPHAGFADVMWRMMVCGIGFGFFQSPNNRTLIAAAPPHRSGAASGMLSTARLTGQTLGSVVVALVFALTHGNIAAGVGSALAAGATFSGVACMISFLRLTTR